MVMGSVNDQGRKSQKDGTRHEQSAAVGYPVDWNRYNNSRSINNNHQRSSRDNMTEHIEDQRRRARDRKIIRDVIGYTVFAVLLLLLTAAIIAVTQLDNYAHKKLVKLEVDALDVNSLIIIPNNDPNHPNQYVLNAGLYLTLSMDLKKTTSIDSPLMVTLEYQGVIFSTTTVENTVYHRAKNQTLGLHMDVVPELPQGAIDLVTKDLAGHNDLEFTVHARGSNWTFSWWFVDGDQYDIVVECKGVKVRFPSSNVRAAINGNMINAPIYCDVKLD